MNLNQSAHGDREFGFIGTRMRLERKVVVGHWQDAEVLAELAAWARAACAWHDCAGRRSRPLRRQHARGGRHRGRQGRGADPLRLLASTATASATWSAYVDAVSDAEVDRLVAEYDAQYAVAAGAARRRQPAARRCARRPASSWACAPSWQAGGFKALHRPRFEDLHGLEQLPGLAVQRLMADGYGFGAEGDWKTAALVRAMKVMAAGLPGGTSFMEDYTYHLDPARDEGARRAHARDLPVDRREAALAGDPSARHRRQGRPGPAGVRRAGRAGGQRVDHRHGQPLPHDRQRGRTWCRPTQPLPKLPVARALWMPQPDLKTAAAAWILAGGAHHTGFSQALTAEHLEDFAEMAGIEFVLIDEDTRLREFKKELRWNEVYYHLAKGL